MSKWEVGQRVYLRDINENRRRDPAFIPPVVTITKVGRTLVHIVRYGRTEAYGKDDGVRRDNYRHARLQTFEEFAEEQEYAAAVDRLNKHGITFEFGSRQRFTAAQIAAICDLLDGWADQ